MFKVWETWNISLWTWFYFVFASNTFPILLFCCVFCSKNYFHNMIAPNLFVNYWNLLHIILFIVVEHCLFVGLSIKLRKYLAIMQRNPPPNSIAIVFCYVSENATFVWNFIDIFIMVIGIGLTMHFKVLNDELERAKLEIEVEFSFFKFQFKSTNWFWCFRIYQPIIGWKCEHNSPNCANWSLWLMTKFPFLFCFRFQIICSWFANNCSKVWGCFALNNPFYSLDNRTDLMLHFVGRSRHVSVRSTSGIRWYFSFREHSLYHF